MNFNCPNCNASQVPGTARCTKCGYNGLFSTTNTRGLIMDELLDDEMINREPTPDELSGGESMVVIERPQETKYLKAAHILENKISELKIVTEPVYVDTEFEGTVTKKLQCEVAYNGMKQEDPNLWTMNKTSSIALFDHKDYGSDTKNWMNKAIPITVTGEGKKSAIMVDKIRLG